MAHYLIQFRFQGYAKQFLKQTIYEVGKKFRVWGATKKKVVPHITLFGPFTTNDERKVVSTFLAVSKKYHLMSFKLKGFDNFDNRVIFVDITPSEELKRFRKELANELIKLRNFLIFKTIKTSGISDYEEHYPFHATIAFKDIQNKFRDILHYLKNQKTPYIKQKILRITLLKNCRILYEYDFFQGRLLNREEALGKFICRLPVTWRRS